MIRSRNSLFFSIVINHAEEVLNGKYRWVVIDYPEAKEIVKDVLDNKIK